MSFQPRFYVYRLFDANDVLLYVGKTRDFNGRLTYHRRPWYTGQEASCDIHDLIDHWVLEEVSGELEAAKREREVIATEAPLYNRWRPAESGLPQGPLASRVRFIVPTDALDALNRLMSNFAPEVTSP